MSQKRAAPSVRDFFLDSDSKKIKLDADEKQTSASPAPKLFGAQPAGKSPILVMLPGASGTFTKDFMELLLPRLKERFEVRMRPAGKWKGWSPKTNAQLTVETLCPRESDAAPWYVMGCSFGNRVAVSVVADKLTPVAPSLILTGYPMYGPNGDEARVEHIKTLPISANVLAISGDKDEFLNKNVPEGKPRGDELWQQVHTSLACKETTTLRMMPKGGHGVYPSAKGKKHETTEQIMKWINEFTSPP